MRAKQRVVLEPPGLLADERPQRTAAFARSLRHSRSRKRSNAARSARRFSAPHVAMLDARRRRTAVSVSPIAGGSAASPPSAANSGDRRHADEDRIDRHRADRRVWRLLARRHLVERQQLQDALAGAGQPGGERRDVADVADAPARRGRCTRTAGSAGPRVVADSRASSCPARSAIEMPQHVATRRRRTSLARQQAHDQIRLARKVKEVSGVRQNALVPAGAARDPLRFERRHAAAPRTSRHSLRSNAAGAATRG